jgi:MYXO-CTERM domain-containing protein
VVETNGQGELNPETMMIEFRPLQALTENAAYTWKVIAIDIPPGEESEPGEIWSFTVNTENSPPDLPHFISPEENETVKTLRPTLKVAGGTRDLDSESLSHRLPRLVHGRGRCDDRRRAARRERARGGRRRGHGELDAPPRPRGERTLHRRVLRDGRTREDGLRDAALLRLRHGRGPAPPNLVAPSTGPGSRASNVFMDWEDVEDPEGLTGQVHHATYCLQVAEGDARCTDTIELLDSGFGFPDAVHGATYLWHVVAVDAAGNKSGPSVEWSFVVDDLGTGETGGGGGSADGCGCRAVGAPATSGAWWLLMLFAGAGLRLRRRR